MKRKIMDKLALWKNSKDRKPLIIDGARQVGKTYIVNEFAKQNYDNSIYVNFETNLSIVKEFDEDISPKHLIERLELFYNQKIDPNRTLIIFDEIQACERALTSLKYFCEDAKEYNIIATGSLLGIALNRKKYSFPVGKIELLTMYPLDFEEFMWATDNNLLLEKIEKSYVSNEKMDEFAHELAMELYKKYLIIGGMPAVVNKYIEENSLFLTADVQKSIIDSYIADMAKYTTGSDAVTIQAAYDSIPAQLAKDNKKFQYKVIKQGATASIFETSIHWLKSSGIILRCNKIEQGFMPISVYQNFSSFKIYMGDVGLLTFKSGIAPFNIVSKVEENNTFLGAIVENYVAISLSSNGFDLYYWESNSQAEVDFVIQDNEKIIPIEVKASTKTRSKSLNVYISKYKPEYAIRISAKNFGFENNIKSVPLYAVYCIKK